LKDTLYIADTYNHKIKAINLTTGDVRTIAGTGQPGSSDEPAQFHEPAGLAIARGRLYVADTNNHLIRTVDLATGQVGTVTITSLTAPGQPAANALTAAGTLPSASTAPARNSSAAIPSAPQKPSFRGAEQKTLPLAKVKPTNGQIELQVALKLPDGWKINPLAPMSYWLDSPQPTGPINRTTFGRNSLDNLSADFQIPLRVDATGADDLQVSLTYYYCQTKDEGVCKVGAIVFSVPIQVVSDGSTSPIKLVHTIRD
jgi:hypothetical protein